MTRGHMPYTRAPPCEHRQMARRRFLVEHIRDNTAELRGEDARHLARVLRAEAGQQYEIADGEAAYLAEISAVEKDRVVFRVLEAIDSPPPSVRLTLYTALIKFDRFEWLVEKATELGAAAIVPVNSARSEKGLAEAARKRAVRWRRIAHESSQQARRVGVPEIGEPMDFAAGLVFRWLALFSGRETGRAPAMSALPPQRPADPDSCTAGGAGRRVDRRRTGFRSPPAGRLSRSAR